MSSPNFAITLGKGFRMRFENGYGISVQWGPGNYCDNYSIVCDKDGYFKAGKDGSNNAECAVLDPKGRLIDLPKWAAENDQVTNRSTPAQVLRLMNWASKLKGGVK